MFVDIGSRWLKMCEFDVRIWMLCLKKRWAFSTRHFATLRNRSSKISSVFWGRSCWVVIHALNSWSFASISSAGIVSMLLTDSLSFTTAVRLKLNLKCRKKSENAHTRLAYLRCTNFSYLVFCMVNTLWFQQARHVLIASDLMQNLFKVWNWMLQITMTFTSVMLQFCV